MELLLEGADMVLVSRTKGTNGHRASLNLLKGVAGFIEIMTQPQVDLIFGWRLKPKWVLGMPLFLPSFCCCLVLFFCLRA
jgi:hypothetical protein